MELSIPSSAFYPALYYGLCHSAEKIAPDVLECQSNFNLDQILAMALRSVSLPQIQDSFDLGWLFCSQFGYFSIYFDKLYLSMEGTGIAPMCFATYLCELFLIT